MVEEEGFAVEGEAGVDDSAKFSAEEEGGYPGAIVNGRRILVMVDIGEGMEDLSKELGLELAVGHVLEGGEAVDEQMQMGDQQRADEKHEHPRDYRC